MLRKIALVAIPAMVVVLTLFASDNASSQAFADVYLHNPRGGNVADNRVESKINRTPPVVARHPVSTAGLNPGGIRETPAQRLANPKFVPQVAKRPVTHPVTQPLIRPDQRLANPKFVPQASNRGRSEPALQN